MGTYVQPTDFAAALPTVDETRLAEVIADVEAMATLFAPGIEAPAFLADADKMAQAKALLRSAVIYQMTPDNDGDHPKSPTVLAPSQVEALRALTRGNVAINGIYSVRLGSPDTLPRY